VIMSKHNELVALVIQWVKENKRSSDFPDPEITENTDLMAAGLLNSFDFVDLVLFIEEQSGLKINLADVDPGEFTIVKGLCSIALSQSGENHQQPIDMALPSEVQQLPH
jgi:acyl carrier protein